MAVQPHILTKSAVPASVLTLAVGALTGGAAAPSATPGAATRGHASPPVAALALGSRLQASFVEGPPLSRTADCAAEPRICQAVLKGTGSVQGFGAATEIAGLTQDRGVTPCGPGSDSEVYTRRIETAQGVLALRASGIKCPTADGFRITARYLIDGAASTGVFAGARGSGTDTVELVPGRPGQVTISGKLKLR